jgi:hypothetical protein
MQNVWTSRVEGIAIDQSLIGFTVVGRDDTIGKIEHVNYTGTCLSVATGGLLKKTRHLIPAAAIESIDLDSEIMNVALTTGQIADAPVYDGHSGIDEESESRIEQYYTGLLTQ